MPRVIVTDAVPIELFRRVVRIAENTGRLSSEEIERVGQFLADCDESEYAEHPTIRDWMEAKFRSKDMRRQLERLSKLAAEVHKYGPKVAADIDRGEAVGARVMNPVIGRKYRLSLRDGRRFIANYAANHPPNQSYWETPDARLIDDKDIAAIYVAAITEPLGEYDA